MEKYLYLIFGGILGTVARYFLSLLMNPKVEAGFPYGTFIVNVTGCFLIGIFAALSQGKFILSPEMRLFLMAGFCGAYTTFSTFMLETSNLLMNGQPMAAFFNMGGSIVVGFVLFQGGFLLGRLF